MNLINVAKFGGTSVADAAAMNHCADVVLANPATRVVVLSASAGVTNLLVSLAQGRTGRSRAGHPARQADRDPAGHLTALGNPSDVSLIIHAQLGDIRTMARQACQHTDAELGQAHRLRRADVHPAVHRAAAPARRQACWRDARQLLRTDSRFGKATVDLAATRALCQATLGPPAG